MNRFVMAIDNPQTIPKKKRGRAQQPTTHYYQWMVKHTMDVKTPSPQG